MAVVEQQPTNLVLALSAALCSFLVLVASLDVWPRDHALQQAYSQVSFLAYLVPALAFSTALLLNGLALGVERRSVKMRLLLIVCYINVLAAITDYMGALHMTPIWRDPWGQGFNVIRVCMWLWTTPFMVYLLGMLSDMTPTEIMSVVTSDFLMIFLVLSALSQSSVSVAVCLIGTSMILYCYTMHGVCKMFSAPLDSLEPSSSSYWSLQVVRGFTVTMWSGFVVVFLATKLGLVSLHTEEWLWGLLDFLGKVMFSSSLLQSNFITMEERRLSAMKLVEEGRREQVIRELTSLVQQKEQFMSSMSHELRTPLNGIIGLSDALLIGCGGDLTDISHRTISTIKSSGLRLLTLINDILDAASMQHGKLVIRQEKVRLDRLVDDVMDLLKPLARKDVRLVNNIPSSMPPILGDTGRVMQILHNLIGNACKFTNQGSIGVHAILKMDEVEVAVADTGIGIPKDKYEVIFKAFEQVDMSTTRQYGGTGLGLNLVKQLVEAHGGKITVKSKLNVGTTFYFTFKVWDPTTHEEPAAPPDMTPADIEATKKRVSKMMSILTKGRDVLWATAAAVRHVTQEAQQHMPASGERRATPALTAPAPALQAGGTTSLLGLGEGTAAASMQAPVPGGVPAGILEGHGSGSGSVHTVQVAPQTPVAVSKPVSRAETSFRAEQAAETAPAGVKPVAETRGVTFVEGVDDILEPPPGPSPAPVTPPSPVASQPKSIGELITAPEDETPYPYHVLSVDDDPVNQMVISTWLTPKGFRITQAMDGPEALEVLEKAAQEDALPDIILLDVMMPGMSGHEVCRKLRDLYPSSCVPVIIISAKGKEDDVVEGLAVGANDYILKPFGRKELLARIQAHLRFKTKVLKVATEGSEADRRSARATESLVELLCASSKAFSLPASIKSQVENSTGVSAPLQVFDDLTMLVIGITNLDALTGSRQTNMPEVLGGLASLYIYLEDLLLQHHAYLVDCLEDKLVIVTGLGGDNLHDQVNNAVSLAVELQKLASTVMPGPSTSRLLLSAGIHCCTATAVIVGVQHPVLMVTGALADRAVQLQCTSPPGCVHVSKRVYDLSGQPENYSPAVRMRGSGMGSDMTFLHHSGPWNAHLASMSQRFERYMGNHPFGPINSGCLRLRPVQRAMLSLVQADIHRLVEFLQMSGKRSISRQMTQDSLRASAHQIEDVTAAQQGIGSGTLSISGMASTASPSTTTTVPTTPLDGKQFDLVTKLQLDKEELVRQLEQKTTETDKLHVVVDNLQLDLYGLETLQTQLDSSTEEVEKLRTQVATLQSQLLALHAAGTRVPSEISGAGSGSGTTALTLSNVMRAHSFGKRARGGASSVGNVSRPSTGQTAYRPRISYTETEGAPTDYRTDVAEMESTAWHSRVNEDAPDEAPGTSLSIAHFLNSVGMPHLIPVFEREEITPDMLSFIHDATLLELGVTSVGDLVRLRRACAQL